MNKFILFSLFFFLAGPSFGNLAYITNEKDNTVSVIDIKKKKVIKTVEVGQRPRGIIMSKDGKLQFQSEDIGRHNAVDKVIGRGFNQINFNDSILLLSGRCGWDIVAKAARCNISNIASFGACSSLAASCARSLGITIHSFVKENNSVIIG